MYDHLKVYGRWQKDYASWINAVLRVGGLELLDVGTAYGAHVKAFREVGIYAWGCDKEVEFIKKSPFGEIRPFLFVWDVRKPLGEMSKKWDVVLSHSVLEHLTVDELMVAVPNMLDVLSRGGLFCHIITVKESPGWAVEGDPTHVTIKSIEWWKDFFRIWNLLEMDFLYKKAIERAEEEIRPFRRDYGWGVFIYEKT